MKTEPPAVRLNVSTIAGGQFYPPGSEVPFTAETLPEHLRPYISQPDEPAEVQGPPGIRFEPNRVYDVNPEGAIITRRGRREAGRLAAAAMEQEAAEAAAEEAGALDPETAAILQEKHDVDIALQIKAAEVAQARRDDLEEAARAEALRAKDPAKPAERFVRRGAVYAHVEKAKLRLGETVFVRQPSGEWWGAGLIDANGSLPTTETIL